MSRAPAHAASMAWWILATLPACQGPGERPPARSELERGLYFEETDSSHRVHAISSKRRGDSREDSPIELAANGAVIDVNSRVVVEPRLLPTGEDGTVTADPSLQADVEALRAMLADVALVLEGRRVATDAWRALLQVESSAREGSVQSRDFAQARRALGEREEALFASMRRVWPRDDPEREAFEEALDLAFDPEAPQGEDLSALIDRRLGALQARLREVSERVARRQLRLEAFLIPDGREANPAAVHLPGYDTLDEKRVRRIDRLGLALSAEERARLSEWIAASKDLALVAERVRTGEASLARSFAGARTEIGRELGRATLPFRLLAQELKTDALRARTDRLDAAFDAFLAALVQQAASLRERAATAWNEGGGVGALLAADPALAEFLADALRARELAMASDPASWLELLALLPQLAAEASDLAERRGEIVARVTALIEQLESAAREAAAAAGAGAVNTWNQSALKTELEALRALAANLATAANSLRNLVRDPPPAPVSLDVRTMEAIDVPLDAAQPTTLDVRRTDRQAGDSIEVRATLIEDGKPVETLETMFDIEKLGWHAELVPAIVLVTADQLRASSDSGGFSASLSWAWSYGPRPEERDWNARLARTLDWSAGLHATFLNFDNNQDAQVGIGTTLGLWDNRLLFGAGFNPLADDARDGRFYYFVGSSLIPLLQMLGNSK